MSDDAIARLRETVDTGWLSFPTTNRCLFVGVSEIIVRPGLINVDFADVRSVMKDAMMGIGTGPGKSGRENVALAAIISPLLDEPVQDATSVAFNMMGPRNMSLQEVNRVPLV